MERTNQPVTGGDASGETRSVGHFRDSVFDNYGRPIVLRSENGWPICRTGSAHAVGAYGYPVVRLAFENQFEQFGREMHSVADQLHIQIVDKITAFDRAEHSESSVARDSRHAGIEVGEQPHSMFAGLLHVGVRSRRMSA